MNRQEIKNSIERYIQSGNKYALMINAPWGCGKTYLYKHDICDAINALGNGKCSIYISLYGMTSIEELSKQVFTCFCAKKVSPDKVSDFSSKTAGIVSAIFRSMTISLPFASFDGDGVLGGIIDNIDVKNMIVCFDDFERCNIPINELLGYINNLIEHCECKVIILADELNMGKLYANRDVEEKYQTILSGRRVVKNFELESEKHLDKVERDGRGEITIDELKELTELLFSSNYIYRDIKEKVIGKTLDYKPDIVEVLHKIVDKHTEDTNTNISSYYRYIGDNIKSISSLFEELGCQNLRIVLGWLDVFGQIYKATEKYCCKDEYYDGIVSEFTRYSIYYYVSYRTDGKLNGEFIPKYSVLNARSFSSTKSVQKHRHYYFIDKYIKSEYLDVKELNETANFIKSRFKLDSISGRENTTYDYTGTAYKKLKNWDRMDDDEVINNINILICELRDGKYAYEDYSQILLLFFIWSEVGLYKGKLEDVQKTMIDLVNKDTTIQQESRIPINILDGIFSNSYDTVYKPILEARINRNRILEHNKIDDGDIYRNWNAFCKHCEDTMEYYIEHRSFMEYVDINRLIILIKESNNDGIYSIGDSIRRIYKLSDSEEIYKNDFEDLKDLKNALSADDLFISSGITRQIALKQLLNTISVLIADKSKSVD